MKNCVKSVLYLTFEKILLSNRKIMQYKYILDDKYKIIINEVKKEYHKFIIIFKNLLYL